MLKIIFCIALIAFLLVLAFRQVSTLIKNDIPKWKEERRRKQEQKNKDTSEDVGDSDSK